MKKSEIDRLVVLASTEIEDLLDRKTAQEEVIDSEIHFIKSNLRNCLDNIHKDNTLTNDEKITELNHISRAILELKKVKEADAEDYII